MSLIDLPLHWIRAAAVRRVFWLGGPLLLYAWTVTGPFVSDDLNIVLRAERYIRGESESGILDLYRFAKSDEDWQTLRDRGVIAWWLPATGRLDFFRPVTDLAFYLDVRLFGRNVLGYRLDSLLVFAVALLCVHWLFVKATGDPIRAGVATFFFGISQTVTPPVTWMCNRQDLLVVVGVTLAAGAYWSAWTRPRKRLALLAVLALVFALLSKEMAVSLALVVAVHELILRRKRAARRERPLAGGIAALLVLVTICYLGYYVYSRPWVFEFTGGDGLPTQLGTQLDVAISLYAAVWTIGFPVDVLMEAPTWAIYAVAATGAVMAMIVAVHLRKSMRHDRAAVFFLLWAIFFMLPGLRALSTNARTLCVPTVGWAYLLAGLILPSREENVVVPGLLRHFLFAANGTVSIGCVIGTVLFMNHTELSSRHRLTERLSRLDTPLRDGDALIMANAKSAMGMVWEGDRLEYLTGLKDVSVAYLLSPGTQADRIEREDDHTLLLKSDGASLFGSFTHRLKLGPNWKPRIGQTFRQRDFTAEIAQLGGDDAVTALRLRFNKPLSSPRLHFSPVTLQAIARGRGASLAGVPRHPQAPEESLPPKLAN